MYKDNIFSARVSIFYVCMTLATNKTNDNKVIPEPIDDRKFQE
jgi:hypothetical protein